MVTRAKGFKWTPAVIVGAVFIVVLVLAAATAVNAWIVMLLVGGIFPHFGWETWGYGLSVLVTLGLTVVGGFFKSVGRS